jgi:hypothetical protein
MSAAELVTALSLHSDQRIFVCAEHMGYSPTEAGTDRSELPRSCLPSAAAPATENAWGVTRFSHTPSFRF